MKAKQRVLIAFFLLATLILISVLLLYSLDNFIDVFLSKGLKKETLSVLPQWARPLYKGFPSKITLLSYCLFTLSAFLLLKENNWKYKTISWVSFALLLFLLIFFF